MDFIDIYMKFAEFVAPVSALVLASKGITVLTPTKTDDKIVSGILRVLNIISLNVLKDKNKDDK